MTDSADKKKIAITSSKARWKHQLGLTHTAERLAGELGIPYIERNNKGIPYLMEQHQLDCLMVEEEDFLTVHWPDGETLSFHPNMAVHRIRQLKSGEPEILTRVSGISTGESFLDCTMGFGADAIVASCAVGKEGSVVSLESSDLIYATTTYGLQHWPTGNKVLAEAMQRVKTVHIDYLTYLRTCEENSYDIVYFDPMFEKPVYQSENLAPLRREANATPLVLEAIELAKKVAGRLIVVKHRANTLTNIPFDEIAGGTYSRVAYGIIHTENK